MKNKMMLGFGIGLFGIANIVFILLRSGYSSIPISQVLILVGSVALLVLGVLLVSNN